MPTDFDAAARTWNTHDHTDRAQRLSEAILGAVPVSARWWVADIGAGTGLLALQLAPHVAHVLLVDTSPGMLDVAREQTAHDPDRFAVLQHDLSAAPLPSPVDLIVSAMALHHIAHTDALLRHARASLSPGGWVALADLDADPHNHFHDDEFDGHRGIDRHALVQTLRALGFRHVTERTATTVTKPKDGVAHTHEIFLVTGQAGDPDAQPHPDGPAYAN